MMKILQTQLTPEQLRRDIRRQGVAGWVAIWFVVGWTWILGGVLTFAAISTAGSFDAFPWPIAAGIDALAVALGAVAAALILRSRRAKRRELR